MSLIIVSDACVTLDFTKGVASISGTLTLVEGPPPPIVWIGAFFIHPAMLAEGPGGSWSFGSPPSAEVAWEGSQARFVASAAQEGFHWWNLSGIPHEGYVAHIAAGDSPEAAAIQITDRQLDAEDGIPVLCT